MAGLANLTEFGKQGMLYTQASIQVTGRNIANVNTRGYSRQRLDVNPILPEILAGFSLGSAINGDTLRRIREDFTDRQFWSQNSLQFQYSTEESLLLQIEGVLPVDNDSGLRAMLDDFWNSWNNLANDPESSVARTAVMDKAETLVQTFNRVHREFASFQRSIGVEIQTRVNEINRLSGELAQLNKADPGNNLDLDDQRGRIIDSLSELANIQVNSFGNSVAVTVGGIAIVSGTISLDLELSETLDSEGIGSIALVVKGTDKEINLISGEVGAMLNIYNNDIPELIDRLNTLAATLAREVNKVHKTGFDLNDNTGNNFFSSDSIGASSLALDAAIAADPSLIASSDAASEPGNNGLAHALAALANENLIGDQTIGEFQRSMVAQIGTRIQEARFLRNTQEKVVNHLSLQRDSVSGVSIEEEMIRMVQLEQAFATAARLVSVADELTRTLLQLI